MTDVKKRELHRELREADAAAAHLSDENEVHSGVWLAPLQSSRFETRMEDYGSKRKALTPKDRRPRTEETTIIIIAATGSCRESKRLQR